MTIIEKKGGGGKLNFVDNVFHKNIIVVIVNYRLVEEEEEVCSTSVPFFFLHHKRSTGTVTALLSLLESSD